MRMVPGGIISTVAGNGTYGYSGDNGLATSAQISYTDGVAVESTGNLYMADTGNYRIRKVSGGVITTVAGYGPAHHPSDDATATPAPISFPLGLSCVSHGIFFISAIATTLITDGLRVVITPNLGIR